MANHQKFINPIPPRFKSIIKNKDKVECVSTCTCQPGVIHRIAVINGSLVLLDHSSREEDLALLTIEAEGASLGDRFNCYNVLDNWKRSCKGSPWMAGYMSTNKVKNLLVNKRTQIRNKRSTGGYMGEKWANYLNPYSRNKKINPGIFMFYPSIFYDMHHPLTGDMDDLVCRNYKHQIMITTAYSQLEKQLSPVLSDKLNIPTSKISYQFEIDDYQVKPINPIVIQKEPYEDKVNLLFYIKNMKEFLIKIIKPKCLVRYDDIILSKFTYPDETVFFNSVSVTAIVDFIKINLIKDGNFIPGKSCWEKMAIETKFYSKDYNSSLILHNDKVSEILANTSN